MFPAKLGCLDGNIHDSTRPCSKLCKVQEANTGGTGKARTKVTIQSKNIKHHMCQSRRGRMTTRRYVRRNARERTWALRLCSLLSNNLAQEDPPVR